MTPDERTALNEAVCIHQGEDGTVCGHGVNLHRLTRDGSDSHVYVPGRKCPTCDGNGYTRYVGYGGDEVVEDCHTCVASPVRGYVKVRDR